jgi:hypothetical protein
LVKKITIICQNIGQVEAELLEDKNPKTVQIIWENLPFEARVNTWGDEIYFSIPVRIGEENAQETVEAGDLAYWPSGNGFCIFFGPTPISRGNEIRPAAPVNVFGKVANYKIFHKVKSGERIKVVKSS